MRCSATCTGDLSVHAFMPCSDVLKTMPTCCLRMQGFLCWRLQGSTGGMPPSRQTAFSSLQLDLLRRTWVENVTQAGRGAARGTCLRTVRMVLDLLGVRFDALRPTRDGLAMIDVALQAGPDRYIALQVGAELPIGAGLRDLAMDSKPTPV